MEVVRGRTVFIMRVGGTITALTPEQTLKTVEERSSSNHVIIHWRRILDDSSKCNAYPADDRQAHADEVNSKFLVAFKNSIKSTSLPYML